MLCTAIMVLCLLAETRVANRSVSVEFGFGSRIELPLAWYLFR